ncbi:helix-hairpin-helix domain-containing protein [Actinotalea sp. K2]|uniref:helix-hairpin-helix domain-containing protein n=1 Tax=Actinotalea sp. K2 TaxID=2939438 RepID=UPI0020173444|nr:helix-hairpin-helix domain-containing protein [Actinotalea sp. K2]MCL3860578.1 helix-hairpin-helix domain-containing protein [Actinotalea sp. K2]
MADDQHDKEHIRSRLVGLGVPGPPVGGWVPQRPVGGAVARPITPLSGPDGGTTGPEVTGPGSDLRSRALAGAVAAYTAAHGHPLEHDDAQARVGRARWSLRPRAAVAAALVLVLLGAAVVWRATAQVPTLVVGESTALPALPVPDAPAVGDRFQDGQAGSGSGPDEQVPDVVVHVVGRVLSPGVVHLPAGSRLADALEAAGGPTPEADLAAVNLARVVTDGEQVHVPAPGEAPPVQQPAAPGAGDQATEAGAALDLNTADAVQLDVLPGIGPVLAQRIVDWRAQNGPFTSVEELGEVSGIGPRLLEGLRSAVRT